MSNQPWLDSLSDDWPSVPATPTTPAPSKPSQNLLSSQRNSVQNSPSRIPVPARRSVEQSPADDKKKVTRPCHFHRKEPPTPKTPRTPKTPTKLRSPIPPQDQNKDAQEPQSHAKVYVQGPREANPGCGWQAGANHGYALPATSDYEAADTVQIKPKKGEEGGATPEWRKRLVRGEIPVGDQRDLFAPIGLESVFKPPTPGSGAGQSDSIPFTRQDDQLWDFTDNTSHRESSTRQAQGEEDYTERLGEDDYSGTGIESPFGTVNHRAYWADKRPGSNHADQSGLSHGYTETRTASGLEDLRNEGITPITFTRNNTLEGTATTEVIKSALKQVTSKLESLSIDNSRPDSPASDSFLFYNHSEPRPEGSPNEDSLLDVTSHSLPQDLSMGTLDFSRRKVHRPFHQFSPSPFPSHHLSPATLANAKTRSSPLFNRSSNGSPTLPRPSSSHVRPSTSDDNTSKQETMPSSGSPLKLFGEHDTFTNNRLLRRMSQFEETFGDGSGSEGDEPPSPSEEARRKGENRSLLNVRHEPLSEISPRRNERGSSRNIINPRLSRFGDGELDKFDFSDTSPYEPNITYGDVPGLESRPSSRPSSRRISSNRQPYLQRGSQVGSLQYARSASSSFTRKPSAWTRQSYFDHLRDATASSRANKENVAPSETKRVPKAAAMDPIPKRRRTILRDDSAEPDRVHSNGDPAKFGESMSLLQRSLMQHGVQLENGDYLAPPGLSQSMQRPRTPTPSQIRSMHESKVLPSREYSESNFDNLDYSDSFSIEGDIPLVKITGASDTSRKGSITTQDYLNEATKIMDLIRAKGRPVPGLMSVQESDGDSEDEDASYDDESTREAFSRPPSRDGTNTDFRKIREPKELNAQVLNYLKQYQEKDDGDFGTTGSVMSFNNEAELRPDGSRRVVSGARKRKTSSNYDDVADTIAQDLMTINTQMSGFSVRSVHTGSSQNSQAKGVLSSDLVAHLIPEQVNGFTYDKSKNLWIKNAAEKPARQMSHDDDNENNDPFQDIPDLSVDELQEMMRVHGLDSPSKRLSASQTEDQDSCSRAGGASPKKGDVRPHTRDGDPSVNASSDQSRVTRFTSSVPNSGTRATSWGTDEIEARNGSGDKNLNKPDDMNLQAPNKQTRVPTISFSSPVVSHVAYTDNDEASNLDAASRQSAYVDEGKQNENQRSALPPPRRETSVAGQPFIRRPVSRIEERNEEGAEDLSLVHRNNTLDVQQTPGGDAIGNSLIPVHSGDHETSYSFHMSPLAEFSVNQPDHPMNLEMSYVANRTHPTSLRQVHGTFALATEQLIKHITDVEPYEPYWEDVRRLVLRQKGLITLHKLSDFCPRLEDLDVSDNDVGQLSGVPTSLRTLKIPRNTLSDLTPWGHLTNLQYLDISGNDIETLAGFSGLIHLRELKANDNRIRNIDGILDLNGLLSLKLSNNSLTTVDFEGAELTRLRDLDLSHNCLTSVRNTEWLPSLATLDVSANQITQFEASTSLISLRALKLSANRLSALDLKNFSSLSLLYADHNGLSTITGLEHCHNLEVLSIREQTKMGDGGSRITLDLDLGSAKDIRKVFLSSNKLASRCLSPSSPLLRLQLLDIAACTLPALPGTFASSFPNLKVLNMNFNSLSELEPLVGMHCLARLTMVGNRLSRMRRICQILSRLGRTGRGNPCSLRKLDIRGNPLTVGFYPPAVTGNGTNFERKKVKDQEKTVAPLQENRQDLADALADVDPNDHVTQPVIWDDSAKSDRESEINDPLTLPPADPQADEKYLHHLDRATRLRRRVLELLLYAGTSGSLQTLDGLDLRPVLGDDSSDMGQAWNKLEELGVLRRKAITDKA
ncbi:hypothetical protein N7451_009266 [Penicillium sp. IBT 35674x]|nr:hypothetical protein N7451_009266 [Penicillium sp. IBT 35674x]